MRRPRLRATRQGAQPLQPRGLPRHRRPCTAAKCSCSSPSSLPPARSAGRESAQHTKLWGQVQHEGAVLDMRWSQIKPVGEPYKHHNLGSAQEMKHLQQLAQCATVVARTRNLPIS